MIGMGVIGGITGDSAACIIHIKCNSLTSNVIP
jgi:hypothetical protein